MKTAKPNRRSRQDERGRRKRPMPMDGAGLRRIPGLQKERADNIGKEDERKKSK